MAMDEVVGRQTQKEPVDMAVTDAAGQSQKEVETAEGADAFVDLFFDSSGEVRRDYGC